jgi:antitoxin YefM
MISEGKNMRVITAGKAERELEKLLDEAAVTHEPIQITSPSSNGVLLSEEDWRAIQETLHLLSIPGMRESIREGLNTPIEDCSTELKW